MTMWSAAAVAGFCHRAGWRDDDLELAVAVALATSGGADDAEWVEATPPRLARRGLFLLPVYPDDEATTGVLFDPVTNAAAAHDLWIAAGGSWVWHPTFRAGQHIGRLTEASRAAKQPDFHPRPNVTPVGAAAAAAVLAVQHQSDTNTGKGFSHGR